MKSLVLVAASGSAWAVRTASLKPYKSDTSPNRPWCVDVPPNLSDTGKRQRKFFETEREAKAECETLKARRENFGVSLGTMTPARIAEAAEAYKLLDPLSVDLLTAVRDYTRRHHQLNASKPWKEVFDEYQKLPKHRSEKYQKELKDAGETMRPLDRKLVIEISPKNIQTVLWKFAPSTRNAKMRILRAVFNLGIKRGYLVENPINRLDFAELEKGEVETFTVSKFGPRKKHPHNYPDYFPQSSVNPVDVWVYPDNSLGEFRSWLRNAYIPEKFPTYLRSKARQGLFPPSKVEILLDTVTRPAELPPA